MSTSGPTASAREDDAQCLLVIIGATPEGKKELVGLVDGVRESAQSWRELTSNGAGCPNSPSPTARSASGGDRGSVAPDPQPALLGAQDRQHAQQAAQEPALEGKACSPGLWMAETRNGLLQTAPSTPSSRPTPSSRTRRPHAWSRIARRCWRSTTFPPSVCAPPTPSKAHSPPCDTVPCDPRDASPTRRRSPSNSPRRHSSWRRLDGHNQLPKLIVGVKFIDGEAV